MKDATSIKNSLQSDKQLWNIMQVENCINAGLTKLWNDEDIVKAMVFLKDDTSPNILLITNKSRMVVCNEGKEQVTGLLFDRTRYSHTASVYDITGVDANKSRCIEVKESGFFGRTYYNVVFEGAARAITLSCDNKDKAFAILSAVTKYAAKPASAAASSPATPPVSPASAASNSAIAEIRQMYEDGIIDKAEMLDLIKSLNNK